MSASRSLNDVFLTADHPSLRSSSRLGDVWAAIADLDDPVHRDFRGRVRALLASTPEPLLRTNRPGHLTGSAFVVDSTGQRTLMLLHAKLGIWVQPGGHADGDANLAAVALREAAEETGIVGLAVRPAAIDIDIHVVDPPAEDAHEHHDIRFLIVAPPEAELAANHESTDQRWVTFDELPELGVDEGLLRLAAAGFALAPKA